MKQDKNPSNPSKKSQSDIDRQSLAQAKYSISPHESRTAINQVIASAQKIIRIFDYDLSDPGYSDPARVELLESLLLNKRGNLVQIAIHEPQNLDRDCARLMALFRRHTDVFTIRRTMDAARNATDPVVIADEHSYWHKLHHDHPRVAFSLNDPAGTASLMLRFNEIWELSESAIGGSVLGL